MAVYLKLPSGTVHSMTQEHYEKYETVLDEDGNRYPKPGRVVVDEAEARKLHPQEFGAPDPLVENMLTAKERAERAEKALYLEEIEKKIAAAKK